MRYMEGGSLGDRVRTTGPLDVSTAVNLGIRLAGALAEAHQSGVFHRDIKPDNVLFSANDSPALADFGIAAIDQVVQSTNTVESLSPPYAPPERFLEDVGVLAPQGDIYSLGATLYYSLTGRPPFGTSKQGGVAGLLARISAEPLPPVESTSLPPSLNQVLATAMAKSPEERYATAEDMQAALNQCLVELSTSSVKGADAATVRGDAGSIRAADVVDDSMTVDRSALVAAAGDRLSGRSRRRIAIGVVSVAVVLAGFTYLGAIRPWSATTDRIAITEQDTEMPESTYDEEVFKLPPIEVSPHLDKCVFKGSAVVAPGIHATATREQTLTLNPDSTMNCTRTAGPPIDGDLIMTVEFTNLAPTSGTSSGGCTIYWDDADVSEGNCTVTLNYPSIDFLIRLTDGIYVGSVATAAIEGWGVTNDPATGAIVGLQFENVDLRWTS